MKRAALLAAMAAGAGLWPASAPASVTSATVTAPADPADRYFDLRSGPPYPTLSVAGTATTSGASNNSVSLHCYTAAAAHAALPGAVFAVSAGRWSGALSLDHLLGTACRLRAIPIDDANPTDLSKFPGPALRVSGLEVQRIGVQPARSYWSPEGSAGSPNAGAPFSWRLDDVRRTSGWTLGSADCAVTGGELLDPVDLGASDGLWLCAASLRYAESGLETTSSRTELQVDGHNVLLPGQAALFHPDASGFPKLTLDPGRDDAGFSAVEREPVVRCANSSYPLSTAKCSSYVSTGVTLERTIRESGDVQVDVSDRFVSTDGSAHTVEADHHMAAQGQEPGWRFPGDGAYKAHTKGDIVPALKGPFTILLKSGNTLPAGDPHLTHGALTFGDTPATVRFADASNLVVPIRRAVPAGGSSTPVEQTFAVGRAPADFAAITAAAEDRMSPPSVTISSPADGTHLSEPHVTLSGVASDNRGVTALTVAGADVAPAADGSFSRSAGLVPGTNRLVVEARDAAGGVGRAEVTVTLDVAPAGASATPTPARVVRCVVPKLVGTLARKAKAALARARCTLEKTAKKSVRPPKRRKGRRRPHSKVGRVLATKPPARTVLPAGAKVRITVGVRAKKRQRAAR